MIYISLVLSFLFLLTSCASRISHCENQVESYRSGEYACVEEKSFPIGRFTHNPDATRLLLDRAIIRMEQGDSKGSFEDLCSAIDAIDYYRSTLISEKAAQLLIDDKHSPYIAKRYEAIFARIFAAFACYELGKVDDAFVFLKQALAIEDLRNEEEGKRLYSPLLAYLMALHLERQNDFSQAALFYQRAYDASLFDFIKKDVERISQRKKNGQATVLFIVHQGLIPEKTSFIAPASVVSAAAVEILLAGMNIPPAVSSLSGIALPAFPKDCRAREAKAVKMGNMTYRPEKIEDLFTLAKRELDEEIPKLATQAAARLLIRRAAVGAVREKNPLAGDIADLFTLVANMATEADTRMWKTLPHAIYFMRVDVPPGHYQIEGSTITLKSGQLYVQQLFYPKT